MSPEERILTAIAEIRETDQQIIKQQRELIAELQSQPPVSTYLLQIADVIGQMKPLFKTQESKLMGWVAELVRLHDIWEKEGEH